MTWFTLFYQDSGAWIAATPKPTDPTETIGVITTPAEPDMAAVAWDPALRAYVALPSTGRLVISRTEFLERFTGEELGAALVLLRSTDDATFAALVGFLLYIVASTAIDLQHGKVTGGLAFLVSHGVVAAERVAVITAPAPAE